jgi:hypothetical protein
VTTGLDEASIPKSKAHVSFSLAAGCLERGFTGHEFNPWLSLRSCGLAAILGQPETQQRHPNIEPEDQHCSVFEESDVPPLSNLLSKTIKGYKPQTRVWILQSLRRL